jgi:hypothetical protein
MSDTRAAASAVPRSKGAIVVSVLVLIVVFGWLVLVAMNIGSAPVMGSDGKTVLFDKFTRTKDIFTAILPLLTTAVGFWLGSQGTMQAQQQASNAHEQMSDANDKTNQALRQQAAVVAVASSKMPAGSDILVEARTTHPDAFENWGSGGDSGTNVL